MIKNALNKMKTEIPPNYFSTKWQEKRKFWGTPMLRSYSVGAPTL
jgi:hypothetical protein